eukprot:SAG11_NODE_1524_length_4746_cov_5.271358_2_plen_70_part_00
MYFSFGIDTEEGVCYRVAIRVEPAPRDLQNGLERSLRRKSTRLRLLSDGAEIQILEVSTVISPDDLSSA